MLIVPYGWDQPDNAYRVQRLGVGLQVTRKAYTIATASEALAKLLRMPCFSDRAAEVRTLLAAEMDWRQPLLQSSPYFKDNGPLSGMR